MKRTSRPRRAFFISLHKDFGQQLLHSSKMNERASGEHRFIWCLLIEWFKDVDVLSQRNENKRLSTGDDFLVFRETYLNKAWCIRIAYESWAGTMLISADPETCSNHGLQFKLNDYLQQTAFKLLDARRILDATRRANSANDARCATESWSWSCCFLTRAIPNFVKWSVFVQNNSSQSENFRKVLCRCKFLLHQLSEVPSLQGNLDQWQQINWDLFVQMTFARLFVDDFCVEMQENTLILVVEQCVKRCLANVWLLVLWSKRSGISQE